MVVNPMPLYPFPVGRVSREPTSAHISAGDDDLRAFIGKKWERLRDSSSTKTGKWPREKPKFTGGPAAIVATVLEEPESSILSMRDGMARMQTLRAHAEN